MDKLKVTRKVTQEECDWLDEDIEEGTVVYEYSGCTYGCCGDGRPVTMEPGQTPFFEMPEDALEEIAP